MRCVKFGVFGAYFFGAYSYKCSGLKNIVLENNQKHILTPNELKIHVSQTYVFTEKPARYPSSD